MSSAYGYRAPYRWRGYKSKWGRDDWFDTNDAILSHETRGRRAETQCPAHTACVPHARPHACGHPPEQLKRAAPDAHHPDAHHSPGDAQGDTALSPGPRTGGASALWEAGLREVHAADA